jgi:5-(carboxyamino)imidazole ribonucleotide mutase
MNKVIGIIMGSDSDLEIMQEAAKILDDFKVAFEITVVSAHRTPERMFEYAKTARERGLKVIIAGAGGAAHLPGMVASITTLPVIGVPVKLKTMDGLDSLLSIVQMPGGVPVATVAINNAKNAGLLAVQILATHDTQLAHQMQKYKDDMTVEVEKKAAMVEQGKKSIGFSK